MSRCALQVAPGGTAKDAHGRKVDLARLLSSDSQNSIPGGAGIGAAY